MSERPQPTTTRTAESDAAPLLSHGWWIPSAFAVLALVLLLVVPTIVDMRITRIRSRLVLASEHARVLVNDLEATFASQLLMRSGAVPPPTGSPFATRAELDADLIALGQGIDQLGPEAVARFAELRKRLADWDSSPHDGSAATAQEGLALLASAERLDSLFTTMTQSQRAEVRTLERIDFITPLILAPIALIAILIVTLSARRTMRFARIAQDERAQVVRAAEARAALLRGVTHDVKNPLGAASGYAQLLEEGVGGALTAKQLDMVRRIYRLVQTAVLTISDLLELARADGELHLEYAPIDLATIVAEVVDDHTGMARERSIDVAIATTHPTPIVTDPKRVRQILANLISNAIKYTPSNGAVRVGIVAARPAADRGEMLGVEVRDTGPGIPPELQSRVFEEFFRVRADGADGAKGNGLGLAISRRIARLLGGDVTVATSSGGGSVFTLWLTPRGAK